MGKDDVSSRVELMLHIWEKEEILEQLCEVSEVVLSDKKENFSLVIEDKMSSEALFNLYDNLRDIFSLMCFYEAEEGKRSPSLIKFKYKKEYLERAMGYIRVGIRDYNEGLLKKIKELEEKVFYLENKDDN